MTVNHWSIGSLFSGIGGLDLGLERAGLGPVLWQVEIDPFCRAVLAKHWPGAERFEDVRKVGIANLRPVDIVCGGFPCQGVSLAGKGAGLRDPRSGLWSEFARIVRELSPRIVVVENVPGLMRRGLEQVVADLCGAGYEVDATRLSAADVGAPHRRERLFIVAYSDSPGIRDTEQRGQGRRLNIRHGGSAESVDNGETMANGDGVRRQKGRIPMQESRDERTPGSDADGCNLPQWPPAPDDLHAWRQVQVDSQPAFCRLADGIPEGLVRNRSRQIAAYGNAVVPACAEIVGQVIKSILSKPGYA